MFDSFSVRTFVNGLLGGGRIGTIFAFSGQMAQFVPEGARQRFIMDFVDMDSAKFAAYADKGGALAWLYRPEAERLRSEEHTSELQSLMRISYAVFCLKKKNKHINQLHTITTYK